jgi:hypothetical protein
VHKPVFYPGLKQPNWPIKPSQANHAGKQTTRQTTNKQKPNKESVRKPSCDADVSILFLCNCFAQDENRRRRGRRTERRWYRLGKGVHELDLENWFFSPEMNM